MIPRCEFPGCYLDRGHVVPCTSAVVDEARAALMEKMCPAELAILEAMRLIEEMGADTRLTEAQILLGKARDKVADFIDGVELKEEPCISNL
jgi:hypothetical protein